MKNSRLLESRRHGLLQPPMRADELAVLVDLDLDHRVRLVLRPFHAARHVEEVADRALAVIFQQAGGADQIDGGGAKIKWRPEPRVLIDEAEEERGDRFGDRGDAEAVALDGALAGVIVAPHQRPEED